MIREKLFSQAQEIQIQHAVKQAIRSEPRQTWLVPAERPEPSFTEGFSILLECSIKLVGRTILRVLP